jgi:hypothetical protein
MRDVSPTTDYENRIQDLKVAVQAAEDEALTAVMFHETWRPTAYDGKLHERMGTSYSTQSFQIIRWALRREMMLALMRLWDTPRGSLRVTEIARLLKDECFFKAFFEHRARRQQFKSVGSRGALFESMNDNRRLVLGLVNKYSEGGVNHAVLEKIRALRNERLAHRQVKPATTPRPDVTDDEFDSFYIDNLELVRLLLTLVLARAFDLSEAADVYSHHAKYFWINARGERTPGHPNYRAPDQHQENL